MIRRSILIASTAVALTVAGCGGNNNPTPTPSPSSPTPSPSASATPTYSSLPLTAAAEVFTVTAATSFTGDPAAGPVTLSTANTASFSNRVRFALQNVITGTMTTEVVARENADESRFTGTNVTILPSVAGAQEYAFRKSVTPAVAGEYAELELYNNTIENPASGTTPKEAYLNTYKRVSYAAWTRSASTTGVKKLTYGLFGYPTIPSDMPNTGTSTYTVNVVGRAVVSPAAGASSVDKLTGTATLSVNYATGLVTLTLNLNRGATAYGTFTGTGAIASGENQFTGSFGAGSTAGGTFQGLAYGSKGAEMGISFAITQDGAASSSRAVGVVLAKKN